MKVKALVGEENGVSVVTGAIVVAAVVAIVLSIFLAFWIPRQGYEKEREHVEEIRGSFSKLKSAIETIELLGSRTVDVKMNADPIPIFGGPAKGGLLSFDNSGSSIGFQLNNSYYVDQTWVYENGAVILVQGGQSIMASMPAMVAAVDNERENIRVEVHVVRLKGKGTSIGGTGTRTIVIVRENVVVENYHVPSLTIAINSAYPDAWREYLGHLESRLNAKGYNAAVDDLSITIDGKVEDDGVNDIYYFRKVIEVEISIG
ncbi:MAG: hypothetical protein QMC89_06000 [Candidatus Hodarchaeaceae archaeon]|nr:hypothetical protein [Candidatus Hodarchaeaceae archaeon]